MSYFVKQVRHFIYEEEHPQLKFFGKKFHQSVGKEVFIELILGRTQTTTAAKVSALLVHQFLGKSNRKKIVKQEQIEFNFEAGQGEYEIVVPLASCLSKEESVLNGRYDCRIQFDLEEDHSNIDQFTRYYLVEEKYSDRFQVEAVEFFSCNNPDPIAEELTAQANFYTESTLYVCAQVAIKFEDQGIFDEAFSFLLLNSEGEPLAYESVRCRSLDNESTAQVQVVFGSGQLNYWQTGEYQVKSIFQGIVVQENSYYFVEEGKLGRQGVLGSQPVAGMDVDWESLVEYPEEVENAIAVKLTYAIELSKVVDYLANDLSVLIQCDRILVEYIYEYVISKAGKHLVMDSNYDLESLIKQIETLEQGQVMVIRSLDILANQQLGAFLLYHTLRGKSAQFLAFIDPGETVSKVVLNRFAIHMSLLGIPRMTAYKATGANEYTHVDIFKYLVTKKETTCFAYPPRAKEQEEAETETTAPRLDRDGLYKQVSKLNVIQFRNAMKYISTIFQEPTDSEKVYREIRSFKVDVIGDDIEIPKVELSDIGGYDQVKAEITRMLKVSFQSKNDGNENRETQVKSKGFIFYGPPGTGKTLFAKAIANQINATIQMVSGPEIIDKWVGSSEANLRRIFTTARRNAPSVILFDEFDSIAAKRTQGNDGGARVANSIMAQLLTELDGFREDDGILVIGTTNQLGLIDSALLRPSRLTAIKVDLPDLNTRKEVARIHGYRFRVEEMVKTMFSIALEFHDAWLENKSKGDDNIPFGFFQRLFEVFPDFQQSFDSERKISGYQQHLTGFFNHLEDLKKACERDQKEGFADLKQLQGELIQMAGKYDMVPERDENDMISLKVNQMTENSIQSDIRSLFTSVSKWSDQSDLSPASYWNAILDMIAEFTDQFNNDDIRAVFQEAWMDYKSKGTFVTPRFLGQKIGLLRKRKEEQTNV